MKKRILSLMLCVSMLCGMMAGAGSAGAASNQSEAASFESELESKYVDPDREYQSDIRWWIGEASNTDEAILEEIQTLYDGGFHGVELCMQTNGNADDATYAYGSPMWSHKWKLMMNKLLDLGMEVSLTSGTNWATSNVPGLDPDSQQASQVIAMGSAKVKAGETAASLPKPSTMRETNKGKFIGAYAYKVVDETTTGGDNPTVKYTVDYASSIDLSKETSFTEGATIYDQAISWTAPSDGDYVIFAYWTHGNYHTSSPAAETCYATNYFDVRGVEALKEFWETHYLDDPELNAKILEGDVQLFMDSIELTPAGGITWWSEDMRDEFIARKGYDPLPYLFLVDGLPQVNAVYTPYYEPAMGNHDLADNKNMREKIVNDWVDILTQLYCENMLVPLKEWLNSVGIETRAQISYGRSFEITEPSMYVDYPEAENFNQYNQVDVFRLHTAGAKLQNKVLSTETGAALPIYTTTYQMRLNDVYSEYAAGFQRVIWHIWSSSFDYGENVTWPGYSAYWHFIFDHWGSREPNSKDYDEFNAHIGRIQQLLQEGKSRTDIGFIHNNWNQGMCFGGGTGNDLTLMNYMLAHQGVYYRSTELQDNGYTYDYLSPDLLFDDDVYFDEETKTVELAGYKALVLYQNWLDVKGAEKILEWAKKGLPVFIMEGAAERTPFNDGEDARLAEIMAELKSLDTVRTVDIYDASEDFDYFKPVAEGYDDGLYEAVQEMGIRPYAEYAEENHQLLTQTRQDENGNMYLYAYNYCSNDYHQNSHIESVQNEDHGLSIQTEIKMDGLFVPYMIDAWSGEVTELGNYRYENGQTIFSIDLDYANIALYAFEKVDEEKFHAVSTNADAAYATEDGVSVRATQSGDYVTEMNNGDVYVSSFDVPAAFDITGWDLTVQSWSKGDNKIYSEETIDGVHTINTKYETVKTDINVQLDQLTTWDNIPEIGKDVSGLGYYKASFNWDASKADGAYLNFGDSLVSGMKVWINGQKVGGDISTNPTKVKQSVGEGFEGKALYSGGINWVKPVADISEYLVNGENSIVIEYSSSLGNYQLSRGAIRESENAMGWWNNDSIYRSYGPMQAVVVPFVEETIAAPELEPVKSASAPEAAQVNSPFVVTVITAASVSDVRLANENGMLLKASNTEVTENEDGTKTWLLTMSVGTVGNGRTFKVVTKGTEGYYKDSGKMVSLNITSIPAAISSFEMPSAAVANRTFIVRATTDTTATKINVYNEYGIKMVVSNLSYKDVDGVRQWTGVMSIGTKGTRSFNAYAVNKFGAMSETPATDTITVKAFA